MWSWNGFQLGQNPTLHPPGNTLFPVHSCSTLSRGPHTGRVFSIARNLSTFHVPSCTGKVFSSSLMDSVISSELAHRSLWADCQIKVGPEWRTAEWADQERRTDVEGEEDGCGRGKGCWAERGDDEFIFPSSNHWASSEDQAPDP